MSAEIYLCFPTPPELQPLLTGPCTVHCGNGLPDGLDAATRARVRIVVTNGIRGASAALMDCFPRLQLIASLGIGVDSIDLPAAAARGIAVTNTPGVIADDVADLAIAQLITLRRRCAEGESYLRSGQWPQGPFPLAQSATGIALGLVGLGAIGKAIAERATACRMVVRWHGPRPKPDAPWPYEADLHELARQSTALVVACSGGAATHHLISSSVLQALGPAGVLINIARGSVVDTQALVYALQSGVIAGAALDVYEQQPQVPAELLALPNVRLTPHLGTATRETRGTMAHLVMQSVAAYCAGQPLLNRVV
jgi:lactate dehydrogenase-like 2-hydroxyacid dehydrogenase